MNLSLFTDRRATGLLNRVREDVSNLHDDIGTLLSHTTKTTLPNGARELADQAKQQLAAGGAYAASRLRHLRSQPPSTSASWIGGVLLVGLVAYGVHAICQNRRAANLDTYRPEDELPG